MTADIHITPLHDWLSIPPGPLVIAGPCSAENERQVMETAAKLALIPGVHVFRAGIWKPRTRPGSFEGVGTRGLKWLCKAREETGLMLTVEVANPGHVREALDHGIDILWIGARTVVNPFAVQEIGEAIGNPDIPVMIKNPLNPDLKTWVGAIERLNRMGFHKLIAIHRGFSFFNRSLYRNAPMWEIPIELKRLCPALPVLVDPSHICGNRELIPGTIQKALDLEMHGLMIEVHHHPSKALTDKNQQISPDELKTMLASLIIRNESGPPEFESKLEALRSEIDKLDAELLEILARRMNIVEEIGEYKKANRITILQIRRWNQLIHERIENGINLGLSREFLTGLLQAVHEEGIQRQLNVMNTEEKLQPPSHFKIDEHTKSDQDHDPRNQGE
ncbi:MAG TPA: bifunctional 3-deoxy-7-phosphoheptulonate synthase/chorismate mutase type II [Bacteroidales bacterium]|nr:bifunctional 3-deoxy-7-phosphoheptulonate synthase/chorismate mutase type II [Bacteroidales bacterium]